MVPAPVCLRNNSLLITWGPPSRGVIVSTRAISETKDPLQIALRLGSIIQLQLEVIPYQTAPDGDGRIPRYTQYSCHAKDRGCDQVELTPLLNALGWNPQEVKLTVSSDSVTKIPHGRKLTVD